MFTINSKYTIQHLVSGLMSTCNVKKLVQNITGRTSGFSAHMLIFAILFFASVSHNSSNLIEVQYQITEVSYQIVVTHLYLLICFSSLMLKSLHPPRYLCLCLLPPHRDSRQGVQLV